MGLPACASGWFGARLRNQLVSAFKCFSRFGRILSCWMLSYRGTDFRGFGKGLPLNPSDTMIHAWRVHPAAGTSQNRDFCHRFHRGFGLDVRPDYAATRLGSFRLSNRRRGVQSVFLSDKLRTDRTRHHRPLSPQNHNLPVDGTAAVCVRPARRISLASRADFVLG